MNAARPLGWASILRLGLVQTALGSIVVLTTSTINRVMVIELALPAMLPGLLVGLHYAVQLLRPRLGYGSDVGGRRTPWIVGGMATLALGGVVAALATRWLETDRAAGIALAIVGFLLVGIGVGAAGTSLLVLLAKRVDESRRAAAASIVWIMMIVGFIVTASVAGRFLEPFSMTRLVQVATVVSVSAFLLALAAVWNVEGAGSHAGVASVRTVRVPFRTALRQVWAETQARRFTVFVFVSMLAYSAQDLILEPFAGTVFALTPGESTRLSGVQNGGVLLGMLLVGLLATRARFSRRVTLRHWTILGCAGSAAALLALAGAATVGGDWPLRGTVFALGAANGVFAVSAIGSMMKLAGTGRESREGVRMGLWGAAQAVAFGLGGLLGATAFDVTRWVLGTPAVAYATVFALEAILFVVAACLVARVGQPAPGREPATVGGSAAPLAAPLGSG